MEKFIDETFADGKDTPKPVARYTFEQSHLKLKPGNFGILIQFPVDYLSMLLPAESGILPSLVNQQRIIRNISELRRMKDA